MEKQKTTWHFSVIKRKNEIAASLWEVETDIIKDYRSNSWSYDRYDDCVIASRFFDTEEEARKYYDEFAASAYSFDLEKLKGGAL